MKFPPVLDSIVDEQPYPLLFVTVSGAHLYGFASPDSDYDLRGVHVLPVKQVVSLEDGQQTIDFTEFRENLELDLVTHDVKKFVRLMLKNNGYVLEQLYSPLVIQTTDAHKMLKELGKQCITANHSHHYLGFADTQWKLFNKQNPPQVKPLLYVFRVLLTGIHLMQTGEIEANLVTLNQSFNLPFIDDLVQQKLSTTEHTPLSNTDLEIYRHHFDALRISLEEAATKSSLPQTTLARPLLNDFLIHARMS